jgi:hypothetical protein
MILSRSHALQAIRGSLEAVNCERAAEDQIPFADETALLGRDAALDSLAFVTFVADLEERLRGTTGRDFVLVGEAVADGEEHPFRSVAALADHLVEMAAQKT